MNDKVLALIGILGSIAVASAVDIHKTIIAKYKRMVFKLTVLAVGEAFAIVVLLCYILFRK